jgi:hypothetical protein
MSWSDIYWCGFSAVVALFTGPMLHWAFNVPKYTVEEWLRRPPPPQGSGGKPPISPPPPPKKPQAPDIQIIYR